MFAAFRRRFSPARAAPALFAVMWSTGFVGAKYGLPHAEPFRFLTWRMFIVCLLLGALVLFLRPRLPPFSAAWRMAVAGVLIHGGYLGGVFSALAAGVNIAVVAVIVGAQPIATACLVGPMLGEKVRGRQWLGFALGFAGVWLVLAEKMEFAAFAEPGALFSFAALASITAGTVYQKRHCATMDLSAGMLIQYAAAFLAMLAATVLTGEGAVSWTGEFAWAMAWLVFVLSLGSIGLLAFLIRERAMSATASLFYLASPLAAFWGFLFFGELLNAAALVGIALTCAGVAMVGSGSDSGGRSSS